MNSTNIETILDQHGYNLVSLIGKGGFSVCYSVFSRKYKENFVCKIVYISESDTKKNSINNEVRTLTTITHPNIIHVFDTFATKKCVFLILEDCPYGDFSHYIKNNGPIKDIPKLLKIIEKILDALVYLEERNIAHKDIKPANILIDKYHRPTIADFGLSESTEKDKLCKDFIGTLVYTAPEILEKQPYDSFKADVWSFGITIFYMATGNFPYRASTMDDAKTSILNGFITIPNYLHPSLGKIVRSCLVMNPKHRKSFKELRDMVRKERKTLNPQKGEICKPIQLWQTNKIINTRASNKFSRISKSSYTLLNYKKKSILK